MALKSYGTNHSLQAIFSDMEAISINHRASTMLGLAIAGTIVLIKHIKGMCTPVKSSLVELSLKEESRL